MGTVKLINLTVPAVSLVRKSYEEMEQILTSVRDKYYTFAQLGELEKAKQRVKTPEQAFKALENEQKYLASLYVNCKEHKHDYKEYNHNGISLLKSIKQAYRNEKDNVFEQYICIEPLINLAIL